MGSGEGSFFGDASRRIKYPPVPAIIDPITTPILAWTIDCSSVKAKLIINRDIVKPIPPSHDTPYIWIHRILG